MVLQGAGDDLRGRGRAAIDQHDDGEGFAAVAVGGRVDLVGECPAALRDDSLPLGEQVVADFNGLTEQAAGVAAQVKDQPLEVAEAVDSVVDFFGGGFLKLRKMNVADAGANFVSQVHGGVRNLITNQIKDQRLGLALAQHGRLHMGTFGAFEGFGHLIGSGQAVGILAIDGDQLAVHRVDDVAGMNTGLERGRTLSGKDDIDFAVLRLDGHADAVIVATLLLAHPGVGLGVVEGGVRVKHAQHAGNRSVVDGGVGLVAVNRLGVVLLDQRVDVGEGLEAVAELAFVGRGLGSHLALQNAAHDGADGKKEDHCEEGAAGAGSHRREQPPDCGAAYAGKAPKTAVLGLKYTTGAFDAGRGGFGSRGAG